MGKTISEIGLIYFIEGHVLGGQTVWEGKRFWEGQRLWEGKRLSEGHD
jgi:hypothetical protein